MSIEIDIDRLLRWAIYTLSALAGGTALGSIHPRYFFIGLWLGFVASYGAHKYISTGQRDGSWVLIIGEQGEEESAD